MCPKCYGAGRYYTETAPGMWQVIPCCQVDDKAESIALMNKIIEWCEQHESTQNVK
jgi:hypothetical protein